MEVRAAGSQQFEILGKTGKLQRRRRGLMTADDFDSLTARILEVIKQTSQLGHREPIFRRVCYDRDATGGQNPCNDVLHRCPATIDVTQLAGAKVFAKRSSQIAHKSDVDEMLCEMRTANTAIACNRTNGVQWIFDPEFRQSPGDRLCASQPGVLLPLDATSKYVIRRVDVETKDVNSTAMPGSRQLDSCNQLWNSWCVPVQLCKRVERIVVGDSKHVDIVFVRVP